MEFPKNEWVNYSPMYISESDRRINAGHIAETEYDIELNYLPNMAARDVARMLMDDRTHTEVPAYVPIPKSESLQKNIQITPQVEPLPLPRRNSPPRSIKSRRIA